MAATPPPHGRGRQRFDKPRRKHRTDSTEIRYCGCTTLKGHSCPNICPVVRIRGKRYHLKTCAMHAPDVIRKELGVLAPGRPSNGGRPRHKTASDILRERFEADADRYLKPLEEAILAMKAVVVGNGASAHMETIEDYSVRLRALEVMLDRVYGKPKQVNEHTGADGAPLEVSVPNTQERQMEVARVLAEVGGLGNALTPPEGALVIQPNASANEPSSN